MEYHAVGRGCPLGRRNGSTFPLQERGLCAMRRASLSLQLAGCDPCLLGYFPISRSLQSISNGGEEQ